MSRILICILFYRAMSLILIFILFYELCLSYLFAYYFIELCLSYLLVYLLTCIFNMMRKCSRQSIHSLLAFIHPHTALVIHVRAHSQISSAQSKAINTANPGSLGTQAYCTTPISCGRSKRHLVEHHSSA
jgi:hypothetical protein